MSDHEFGGMTVAFFTFRMPMVIMLASHCALTHVPPFRQDSVVLPCVLPRHIKSTLNKTAAAAVITVHPGSRIELDPTQMCNPMVYVSSASVTRCRASRVMNRRLQHKCLLSSLSSCP
ncbi:hypothetical protein NOR_07469 [Metarhizium rileyi]|nr:hypothetical protein NOR_07469 [Metarhizium rileyi RCEF 4871]